MNRFKARIRSATLVTAVIISCCTPSALAQKKFPLQIEIMAHPNVGQRVQVQKWAIAFQKIGRRATFRQGKNGEKTRIESTRLGNREVVLAVGILNRDGTITLHGRDFNLIDPKPLAAMLDRLEEFGPGGPPRENPSWGLDAEQLKAVLNLFAARVDGPIDFRSPDAAIASLKLPTQFTVQFSQDAAPRRVLPAAQMGDIKPNCIGLSKGTALAISLAQFGLGFRPLTNPNGGYILEVDTGNESDNLYPVGWKNQQHIFTALPAIGKSIDVDLKEGTKLAGVIELISSKLEIHHFYSAYELLSHGKDVSRITYSRKPDKLSPERLMRILGQAQRIDLSTHGLRTDEAGSIFLWITTEADSKAFRERFKNVKPDF